MPFLLSLSFFYALRVKCARVRPSITITVRETCEELPLDVLDCIVVECELVELGNPLESAGVQPPEHVVVQATVDTQVSGF